MKPIDNPATDKGLGKIIRGKLQEQLRVEPSGCPEAETLAAYFERSLSPSERMACETHFMTCSRCQLFVAELARLSEADEPRTVVGDVEIESEPETGWAFRLVWVAPVLVVLIIGGVWYREKIRDYLRPPEQAAMEEPAPTTTAPVAGGEKGKAKTVGAPVTSPAEAMANQAGTEQKQQAAGVPANAPGSAEGQPSAGVQISVAGTASKSTQGRGAGAAAAPEAETRVLQIPAGGPPAEVADRTLAAAVPAPGARAAVTGVPESVPTSEREAVAKASTLTNYTIEGYTPAYHAKWRVGRGGLIQQQVPDRGWVDIASGVQADLFDITFASPAIGWVVGHEGTVLRTTDGGATWNRVSSPTNEDLVRVSALGDQKAQVITRSGKTFGTDDGGKSWKPISAP